MSDHSSELDPSFPKDRVKPIATAHPKANPNATAYRRTEFAILFSALFRPWSNKIKVKLFFDFLSSPSGPRNHADVDDLTTPLRNNILIY